MAARFRFLITMGGEEVSGDFLPKLVVCRRWGLVPSLFVSFDCDSLSEEWRREEEGEVRKSFGH